MRRQSTAGRAGYSANDWIPAAGPWFDILCIVAAVALMVVLAWRGIAAAHVWMLPLVVLALEANDLLVGLVHWALDKYWRYDTPVVGNLVKTFRGHHPDPLELCSHDYVETNSNTYPFVIMIALLCLFVASPEVNWFMFWFLLIAANSATIHQWAHRERPPRVVCALQRWGLLIAPSNHVKHHDGHMSHYCAITGHLNFATDALGLWRKLEWLITTTTGARPFHALPAELQKEETPL